MAPHVAKYTVSLCVCVCVCVCTRVCIIIMSVQYRIRIYLYIYSAYQKQGNPYSKAHFFKSIDLNIHMWIIYLFIYF